MRLSCETVVAITGFVAKTVEQAPGVWDAGQIGTAVRVFISGQFPALVAMRAVEKVDEGLFLSACERVGKGMAEVLLQEEEV